MTKSAIILAGGKGTRFNGTVKELLPISDTESVIDCSINAAITWGADRIIIISNPDKIQYHTKHFSQDKYNGLNIVYKVQYSGEMWNGLCLAMEDATEHNAMFMADTLFSYRALEYVPTEDIVFGIFRTFAPARYSVFIDGKIVTKDKDLPNREYTAWGCLTFTKAVVDYWRGKEYNHYDKAFNDAMEVFNYGSFSMGEYRDIGTLGSYVEYLSKYYV